MTDDGGQTRGVEQVSEAIVHMDHATQQNAALVEEATAASRMLHLHAQKLIEHRRFFAANGVNFDARNPQAMPNDAVSTVLVHREASA